MATSAPKTYPMLNMLRKDTFLKSSMSKIKSIKIPKDWLRAKDSGKFTIRNIGTFISSVIKPSRLLSRNLTSRVPYITGRKVSARGRATVNTAVELSPVTLSNVSRDPKTAEKPTSLINAIIETIEIVVKIIDKRLLFRTYLTLGFAPIELGEYMYNFEVAMYPMLTASINAITMSAARSEEH